MNIDIIEGRRNRIFAIRAEQKALREQGAALKEQMQGLCRKDCALDEELRDLQDKQYQDLCGWGDGDTRMQLPNAPWPRDWR